MDPKKVVLDISSDDEDDDHKWLTKLLDGDGDVNNSNFDEVIMVVNENEKNVVKNLKVKLKVKDCLLVDDIKDIDDDDECVVLENDPNEKLEVKDDGGKSKKGGVNEDDEIVVVSEKGQVACRDYPHSRHLCIKFPFSTTPNQSHCEQCYCYVCDSLAPCVYWGNGSGTTDHCHATDKDGIWRLAREKARNVSKGAQPRLLPDPQRLAPTMVQPQNPITRPMMVPGPCASPIFRSLNIRNQNRSHMLASRHKLHPDLVSQFGLKHHQNSNLGTRVQKQVFKKTASVGCTTTTNHTPYGSYRGPYGDFSMQQYQNSYGPYGDTNRQQNQNYRVNGMLSGSNKYVRPSQPNAMNTSAPNPPRNQSYTSLMVNQPSPLQPQFSNKQSNPNFQSQVNTSPFPVNPLCQPNLVTPSYSLSQMASRQSGYMDPVQSSYPVPPVQSSYPVPFSRVDSLSVSVADYIQNPAQGTQAQSPLVNLRFQDYELKLPSNQDSVTPEGAVPTSEPTFGELCDILADSSYDWIFDDQPVEPGLLDIPGPNGLNDFSSDSTYIDTGPIFDF